MAKQTEYIAYRASGMHAASIRRLAEQRRVSRSEILRDAMDFYIRAGAPEEDFPL